MAGFKILLVDNSRSMRAAMTHILQEQGFEMAAVSSGQEAIESLKKDTFDLLIMDLYMPAMNGHEVARIIRKSDKQANIPIIALTASNSPQDMELCKSSGMNEFVIKTTDNKALFEVLNRYRDQKQTPKPV